MGHVYDETRLAPCANTTQDTPGELSEAFCEEAPLRDPSES
jgi:hypothetical protein